MINKLNKMLMEGKKENDHHQEKKEWDILIEIKEILHLKNKEGKIELKKERMIEIDIAMKEEEKDTEKEMKEREKEVDLQEIEYKSIKKGLEMMSKRSSMIFQILSNNPQK